MEFAREKELLEHGWRHFQFHAQQRLSLFNFYIVLCGLIVAAWATVMTSPQAMASVGILLSALLSFFSYVFWRLDQRNSYLTKEAEKVIGTAENRLFCEDSKLFCAEKMDEPLGSARHLWKKSWSFGTSLGVIFLGVGVIGLAGAVFSGISALNRQTPDQTRAHSHSVAANRTVPSSEKGRKNTAAVSD